MCCHAQDPASLPRPSLYAQALHLGESPGEAPTLEETTTGSLSPLSDSLLLTG